MMSLRLAVVFALIVCAFAFAPLRVGRVAARSMTQANMAPEAVVAEASNVMSQLSQLLATEADFGGYAGPAGSLIFIGIIIVALAPPLAPKE